MDNKFRLVLVGLSIAAMCACTSQEQYEKEKAACIEKKTRDLEAIKSWEKESLDDPTPEIANLKARYLEEKDALERAKEVRAGSWYKCYEMTKRISLQKPVAAEPTAAELRERAERDFAAMDAAQEELLNEYKRKSVRHYQSIPGAGVKIDVYEMKDGTVHTCKTSVTDAGRATDCTSS